MESEYIYLKVDKKLLKKFFINESPDSLIGKTLDEIDRYYIQKTLEMHDGNREKAATTLGIGERTLFRWLKRWKNV